MSVSPTHSPLREMRSARTRGTRLVLVFALTVSSLAALPVARAEAMGADLAVEYPDPMPRPKTASIALPSTTTSPTPTTAPTQSDPQNEVPVSSEGEEIVSLRARDSKTFRNPDGGLEARFGHYLHFRDSAGEWQDVDLRFRKEGADWVMDRHDLAVRVTPLGISARERVTGRGIFWPTTVAPSVEGRRASFEGPLGLTWSYLTRKSGIKLLATTRSRLGARSIVFPFQLLGGASPFSLDNGALRSDVFHVPPPVALGADDETYPLGSWKLGPGSVVTWEFDDSNIPDSAFPYQLDPTTTFSLTASSNDGTVRRHGTSYAPPCDYAYADEIRIAATRAFDPAYDMYDVHNALMRWNTSTIPDDATVQSATVRVRVTRADNANAKRVTADWYASGWPPITCADSSSGALTTAASSMAMPSGTGDHDFALANVSGVSATSYTGLRFHLTNGTA